MTPSRSHRTLLAAFTLGVSLGLPSSLPTWAQDPAPSLLPNPMDSMSVPGRGYTDEELKVLSSKLIPRALAIKDPGDRAFALDRAARAKIASNKLEETRAAYEEARFALQEAGNAAVQIVDPPLRDQRIMEVVATLVALADEQIRLASLDETMRDVSDAQPTLTPQDRKFWIVRSEEQWRRAAWLASRIDNASFRSQTLYQVAYGEALTSQNIALASADLRRPDLVGLETEFLEQADRELDAAAKVGQLITRAVWRDKTLVSVVGAGAASQQFARSSLIGATIPQPEYRGDAQVRIGESQARHAVELRDYVNRDLQSAADSWTLLESDYKRETQAELTSEQPRERNRQLRARAERVLSLFDAQIGRLRSQAHRAYAYQAQREIDVRLAATTGLGEASILTSLAEHGRILGRQAREIIRVGEERRTSLVTVVEEARKNADEAEKETDATKQEALFKKENEALTAALPKAESLKFDDLRDRTEAVGKTILNMANLFDQYSTYSYGVAARSIASIPLEAPRLILAGVLIDSLITVGRFDDARASVVFYPDRNGRLNALGAVAESMGERRLAEAALVWIDRDVPPDYQARIRRRVGDGVLRALDKSRSKSQAALPGGAAPPPAAARPR